MPASPHDRGGGAASRTPERPVVDSYHGTAVRDAYRWLEDSSSSEVRAWVAAQNARTRSYFDAGPGRAAVHARLTELLVKGTPAYLSVRAAGGLIFALKRQPPSEQPLLVRLDGPDDLRSERVVVDPNALEPAGEVAIDWFVPSPDGSLVAVSLSRSGTEAGDLHVYDTASGRPTGDVVPGVNGGTAGGSAAWDAAGDSIYYTRYPRPGERPPADLPFYVRVHRHPLGGDPAADPYEMGRDLPKIAEIRLESGRVPGLVLASAQNGDGAEFMHWLRDADGSWHVLTRWEDGCLAARLGDDAIYLVALGAERRGRVLRLPLSDRGAGLRSAREIVPEGDDAIQVSFPRETGVWVGADRLYVLYQKGGPNEIRVFDAGGRGVGVIPTPALSASDGLQVLDGGDILFHNQSLTEPPAWLRAPRDGAPLRATALAERSPADFSACEVVRDEAVSPDGTRVPLTILRPKGLAMSGDHPTILYGYGGFGVPLLPAFRSRMAVWTDRGGVLALAHIRGGGEFGDAWHRDGHLARKENAFDDFAACARRLVEAGYTSSAKLALMGGSNGGLLMGATLTRHPGLARAVVSLVGLYDMLRVERTPNGAFNVTEFGSVDDPALFPVLLRYSPYHNVKDGVAYPAVLLTAGENDPRVDPWHGRKMAARLQKATSSPHPVLLRTDAAGHGLDTGLTRQIEEAADVYAFLFRELGL